MPEKIKEGGITAFLLIFLKRSWAWDCVTFFAEHPFVIAVWRRTQGALPVAADQQDGPVSLGSPCPAGLKRHAGAQRGDGDAAAGMRWPPASPRATHAGKGQGYLVGIVLFHHAIPIRIHIQGEPWRANPTVSLG